VAVVACVLALALTALLLHREVLVGGQVYHMDDAADDYYPAHVSILRAYAHGELPTWDRQAWCGWPPVANPYYGAFYPATVLFAIAGAVRGLGWLAALHSLAAALGMFWLLRRRALDVGPALFGGAAFGFSTFMACRIRHLIFIEELVWLVLILVGVEGWAQTRRRRELMLVALATGMAILCGALPLLLFVGLVAGGYTLARLWRAEETWRGRGRALAAIAIAVAVGGAIGAAQAVPTLAHLSESQRALPSDFSFASSYAWPDVRYLGTLIAPDVLGGELRQSWFGKYNHWELSGYYAGALPVLLAPLALFRRGRRELWALAAVALLAILLAFGELLPVHKFFFRYVPLYASMRCPPRALVMLLCAAPILGAEAIQGWLERPLVKRATALAAATLLLVGGAAIAVWLQRAPRATPPPELAGRQAFAHFAAVAACGLAALLLARGGAVPARAAALAVAVIALADVYAASRASLQPKPGDWAAGTDRFAALDWLIAQHPSDRFAPSPGGPFRLHSAGMTYDLDAAGGYGSGPVWRFVNFLYVVNHGAPYPYDHLRDDLSAGWIQRWDSPLVDLMNVRWAIAEHAPAPGWVERFRPAPGAPPHARHEASWDARLAVFENPRPLPRAFVVYGAQVIADEHAQALALAKLDPRKQAIVDRAPEPAPVGDGRAITPAKITTAERHYLRIESKTDAPGVLVASETAYPGWSATLDGKATPLLHADYAFQGVALPAGQHVVELRFKARPTYVGLALSGAGLLALVALALVRRRRDRA
jgi:hypothetical protein